MVNKGLLVKQVRFAMKLTQVELSGKLGVNPDEISKWERNVENRNIPDARIFDLFFIYKEYVKDEQKALTVFRPYINYIKQKRYNMYIERTKG